MQEGNNHANLSHPLPQRAGHIDANTQCGFEARNRTSFGARRGLRAGPCGHVDAGSFAKADRAAQPRVVRDCRCDRGSIQRVFARTRRTRGAMGAASAGFGDRGGTIGASCTGLSLVRPEFSLGDGSTIGSISSMMSLGKRHANWGPCNWNAASWHQPGRRVPVFFETLPPRKEPGFLASLGMTIPKLKRSLSKLDTFVASSPLL